MPLLADNSKNIARDFSDFNKIRENIFNAAIDGLSSHYPIENDRFSLSLDNLNYKKSVAHTAAAQKKALLNRKSITWPLWGTWSLKDKASNKVVDKIKSKVLDVPYYTRRGTFVHKGNEYVVANQSRLKSGVFTRVKDNGAIESHFNFLPGKGATFRIVMDPATAVFKMQVGHAQLPLYPLLKSIGVRDKQMEEAWGRKIFQTNVKDDDTAVTKALDKLGNSRFLQSTGDTPAETLGKLFETFKLNPQVTQTTLGKPYESVGPDTLIDATRKILSVAHQEADPDDRDHMGFQRLLSVEDFFKERLQRDAGHLSRRMLWKATLNGNLSKVYPGALNQQISGVFLGSGLGHPPEEINLFELLDQQHRVIRLGEGGIKSVDQIPTESRHVHGSQFGFIDPVRSPESEKVGVDTRLTYGAKKGKDGKIYSRFRNNKTGKLEYLSPEDVMTVNVAFPGEMKKPGRVRVMKKGKITYADKKDVPYELPSTNDMFTASTNLVPMHSGASGLRLLMAGKFLNQAMALRKPEAPLVQSATPEDEAISFEDMYGKQIGTVVSKGGGVIKSIKKDEITVATPTGLERYDMYNNFIFNQKSYVHNVPTVQVGDKIRKGQVLAKSNYTDDNGTLSLGTNLRVGFMPYRGYNYEDAIVISESAAKKLRSEHMYKHTIGNGDEAEVGKMSYMSVFPTKYNADQMKKIGKNGIAKPGAIVHEGDPLILAIESRVDSGPSLHKTYKKAFMDRAITWEHQLPGIVTDAVDARGRKMAIVKAYMPVREGDKLANRYGNKGVVAKIVPDTLTPVGPDGKRIDIMLNPQGIITRSNPSQIIEAALGKVAEKRGAPYKVPGFIEGSWVDFAMDELKKHGLSDTEDLFDPETNRQIKDVFTGNMYIMRMHHTAESKGSGRDTDMYTSEMIPARGGTSGSKRIGLMETNALISHGATEVLKDAKYVRGQRNDDFWRAFRLGLTPPSPPVPFIYDKFKAYMKGAGININKDGRQIHIMAMTDKDVDQLSGGPIKSADTLDYRKMQPVEGGLFDPKITGGIGGTKWSHIKLSEPMPNPVMEDVVRSLLNLTKKGLDEVLSGRETIFGGTGGNAIKRALERINVKDQIEATKVDISATSATRRNNAVKKMKFLQMFRKTGMRPEELVMSKIPVVPPTFRPITMFKGMKMVADANLLYQDLISSNNNLKKLSGKVSAEFLDKERLMLYNSIKAVTGLGDPISLKLQQKKIKGLLKHVLGTSPKHGMVQYKLLSSAVDVVGRAAITPNPSLDMDHVGVPEEKAWTIYKDFIIRRLVKGGAPPLHAVRLVKEKTQSAKAALLKEMESRPVIINRAPTLHKFGMMAAYPILVKGNTLQISPIVTGGFGADFDGDAMNYHVPVTDKARREAIDKMLPSRNLFSLNDFDVHYVPSQEYLLGLWQASSKKSKKSKQRFRSKEDVIKAYKRGEISADQIVEV